MSSFQDLRKKLIALTKRQLGDAVTEDILLIQTLASVDELTISLNTLSKRLREWHGYILPELDHKISDHETFARLVSTKSFDELKKEFVSGESMGRKVADKDLAAVSSFAKHIHTLYQEKTHLLNHLESQLKFFMPNTHALLGTTITARLLASAGSLKSLSRAASSTIQLFGAEKALFRHLKTGARSPKYGHIFSHQLIQRADRRSAGKVARALADKAAVCVKLDYFKGEFLGAKYLEELQKRFDK